MKGKDSLQDSDYQSFVKLLMYLIHEKKFTHKKIAADANITPQTIHNHVRKDSDKQLIKVSYNTASKIFNTFPEETRIFFPDYGSPDEKKKEVERILSKNLLYAEMVILYMRRKDTEDLQLIKTIDEQITRLHVKIAEM